MKKWMSLVNSVQWKLVVIFNLLLLIAMQLIGVNFIRQIQTYYTNELKHTLEQQMNILSSTVKPVLEKNITDDEKKKQIKDLLNLFVFLKTVDKSAVVRIIDKNGFIVGTTVPKQNELNYKANFPFSDTTNKDKSINKTFTDKNTGKDYQVYIKQLTNNNGNNIGSIYIEVSLEQTYKTINTISKLLVKITLVALGITGFIVILLARTITTPVKEITEQATAMAAGDFNRQVDIRSGDEIGRLAMAFNHLASHLRKALAQKEEEKEKLESVLANMSDGVIATDRHGKIIVKNRWAEKLLNREIELDENIHDVLLLSKPIPLPLLKETKTYLELNTEDPEEHTVVKITFTPIKLQGKEMLGIITVLEDVTEEEKLDRQRKDFVANVSHELRTPLTTIKSYLEALDDGAIHEPELATRFLKVTRQEADRMTRLIQDLLQLSRLDAQKSRFYKKIIHMESMLEAAYDRFTFQCKQKMIDFTLFISKPLPKVFVDKDKIDQVLDNLLSNAVKFTPDGGSIAIIAQRRSDGMIEISIADTGIGIPKKDLGRIFERFYRVDKARSRQLGGTGLGLAIAQEIIHAHEGKIEIDSVYKKGTFVSFTLPPFEPEVIR